MRSDFNLLRPLRSGIGFVSSLSTASAVKWLLLVMLCGLVSSSVALAQDDKQNPGVSWDADKVPNPPVKRGPGPVRRKVPLLMLRWQLWGLDRQNQEFAVPSTREFADGEFVRLSVQVNQEGYLYLMKHTVEKDGKTTPTTMISMAIEKVTKDSVVDVPIGCESKYKRNGRCWWRLRKPAGREVVTAVFSRKPIPELSNIVRKNLGEEVYVGDNLIFQLTQKSPPPKHQAWTVADQKRKLLPGLKGEYISMVQNPNVQNNELLVERIEFTHK